MIIAGDPIRIVAPAALPISLAEFKAQCRIDLADEDALGMGYIRSATEHCEQYTSMGFITQTFTQTFSAFPTTKTGALVLGRKPLRQILGVEYLDSAGNAQTLGVSVYRISGIGADKTPASIWLSGSGSVWPAILDYTEAVKVTYTVGFGDDHNSVPELIRQAVMMAASNWYNYREDILMGSSFEELPFSSKAILREWRPLAVA